MFDEAEELCCTQLGGTVSEYGMLCENIPIAAGTYGLGITTDPCNYSVGQVQQEVEASTPFNWGGLNSLLSTLGAIAVPFLPFLFDTETAPPSGATDNTEQMKSNQGMVVLVGFVLLIALSVGAYLLIKKRR